MSCASFRQRERSMSSRTLPRCSWPTRNRSFMSIPFVRYQVLDIQSDPLAQGFEAHSFDMILASDVLHATEDLRHTLRNIKRLLASNGLLVMIEGTALPRWILAVFGLLKGWWLFTDVDVRGSDPWIPQSAWHNLLTESGFEEIAFLSDVREESDALHSVVLARGPSLRQDSVEPDPPPSVEQPALKRWLIFADRRGVADALADHLKRTGCTPILVTAGESFRSVAPDRYEIRPGEPGTPGSCSKRCWRIQHPGTTLPTCGAWMFGLRKQPAILFSRRKSPRAFTFSTSFSSLRICRRVPSRSSGWSQAA